MEKRPEQDEVVQKSGVLFTYSTKSTMGASTEPFFDLSNSLFSFSSRLRLQTSKSIPCLLLVTAPPSFLRRLVLHSAVLGETLCGRRMELSESRSTLQKTGDSTKGRTSFPTLGEETERDEELENKR